MMNNNKLTPAPSATPEPMEQMEVIVNGKTHTVKRGEVLNVDIVGRNHALRDGDYVVRTDKAMHDRLMALCDAAGVEVYPGEYTTGEHGYRHWPRIAWSRSKVCAVGSDWVGRELTEPQFVAALFGVAPEEPMGYYFAVDEAGPATEQEIAAHLAEQEARKPIIPYVTRVTWRNGYEWTVIDSADGEGNYALHRHGGMMHLVPRNQFTVIEQP